MRTTRSTELIFCSRYERVTRELSLNCSVHDPVFYPVGPLPPDQRILFLDNHLESEVQRLEAEAKIRQLDAVFVAVIKNGIVWLDCQLTTDGESVEIFKRIERLKQRILVAEAASEAHGKSPQQCVYATGESLGYVITIRQPEQRTVKDLSL